MAAQRPDIIIKNGEKLNLYSNPLEELWTKFNLKRPDFCSDAYCKRGYVATWELRNDHLFLTNIDGYFNKITLFGKKTVRYTLYTLFPENWNKPIYTDWFSGKLRIPQGRMIQYSPNGYDSRFEREVIISIDQGMVVKEVMLDNTNRMLTVHYTSNKPVEEIAIL